MRAAWPVFLITTIVFCGVVSHILIWWLVGDDNKHCSIQTLASASSACCCAVSLATKIAVCSACLRCKVLSVWRNCCVFCMHNSQSIYTRNDFKHNHWNHSRKLDSDDDSHWVLLSTSFTRSQLFKKKCYPPFELLRPGPSLNSIESSVGTVVRALAFHQCGLGSIPGSDVICGLSLLVLYSAPRGFFPGYSGFPPSPKTNIWVDLICVDLISWEPLCSAKYTWDINKMMMMMMLMIIIIIIIIIISRTFR